MKRILNLSTLILSIAGKLGAKLGRISVRSNEKMMVLYTYTLLHSKHTS